MSKYPLGKKFLAMCIVAGLKCFLRPKIMVKTKKALKMAFSCEVISSWLCLKSLIGVKISGDQKTIPSLIYYLSSPINIFIK